MKEVMGIENERIWSLSSWTTDFLISLGVPETTASYINLMLLILVVVILVYALQHIVRLALRKAFERLSRNSNLRIFQYLRNNRFPHYLALIAPLSLVKNAIPVVFADFPGWIAPLDALTEFYMVFMIVWIIMSIIKSGIDVLKEKEPFRDKPMESYLQVIQIVFFLFGAVYLFSTLTGKSPSLSENVL